MGEVHSHKPEGVPRSQWGYPLVGVNCRRWLLAPAVSALLIPRHLCYVHSKVRDDIYIERSRDFVHSDIMYDFDKADIPFFKLFVFKDDDISR